MRGIADGQLALYALDTGELLAHGPIHAESSDTVSVKGRGIRIRRIRVPTGGDDAQAALDKDFAERCDEAVEATVARLKAP